MTIRTTKRSTTSRQGQRFSCKWQVTILVAFVVVLQFYYNNYNSAYDVQQRQQQYTLGWNNHDTAVAHSPSPIPVSTTTTKAATTTSSLQKPESSHNNSTRFRLVICGTVQNVQEHLPAIQKSIMRLAWNSTTTTTTTFELVHLLFANHNSTDESVRHLERWSSVLFSNVTVVSLTTPKSTVLGMRDERTIRLAHARNVQWQHVSQISPKVDYVLMMDMDDVNWHLSNVHECFNLPSDWAVCCCNSFKVYYDLWALRTLNDDNDGDNIDNDWMGLLPRNKYGFRQRRRHAKPFRHIPAGHAPIRVKSCFGGAALYKYNNNPDLERIANSNPYLGMELSIPKNKSDGGKHNAVCEHVSFHLRLHARNQSLYIQPSFLNDGPSDERMLFFGAVKKRFEPEFRKSWEDTPNYYTHFWD